MKLQKFYEYFVDYSPMSRDDFFSFLMKEIGTIDGSVDLTEEQVRLIKDEFIESLRLIESQNPNMQDWVEEVEIALHSLQ